MPRSPLFVDKQPGGGYNVSTAWVTTGQTWYVDSQTGTNGEGYGRTPDAPFASMHYCDTILAAQSRGNKGDMVLVMPGHTETINAAAACDLNTAGIYWRGIGRGASRPILNFTTAVGADVNIDAASITLDNFLLTGNIDALTGPVDVNAADFAMLNCEWRDDTGQCTNCIVTDANADRMLIDNLEYRGALSAGTDSAIVLIGNDNVEIKNFRIIGNFAVSAIDCRTTAVVRARIHDGVIRTVNSADLCIKDTVTGSTAELWNLYLGVQDNAANITEAITGATFRIIGDTVYVVNLDNEKAMLINWTASTDA